MSNIWDFQYLAQWLIFLSQGTKYGYFKIFLKNTEVKKYYLKESGMIDCLCIKPKKTCKLKLIFKKVLHYQCR